MPEQAMPVVVAAQELSSPQPSTSDLPYNILYVQCNIDVPVLCIIRFPNSLFAGQYRSVVSSTSVLNISCVISNHFYLF